MQDDSLERTIASYQSAVSVNANDDEGEEYDKPINLRAVRTASNLGAMYQLQPNIEIAQTMYQEALSKVASQEGKEAEVLKTVLAYNLGRTYEESGDLVRASQWFRDVLRQHPEHMECESMAWTYVQTDFG